MEQVAEAPTTPLLNRSVLMNAWARLSVYDRTATRLKNQFIRRRILVIAAILTASIASILAAVVGQTALAFILVILSAALPVIGAYLMNDIIQFTGTKYWIKCRYIAEMMRMHLYLYRTQAGPYAAAEPFKSDSLLNENLVKVRAEVNLDESIARVREPMGEDNIAAAIREANSRTPKDDGLSPISVSDYIQWRVRQQREWYDSRINDDFARLKLFVRISQGFLLMGALISAIVGTSMVQVVALVAITNAISVALTQWTLVGMIGKTYSIFQIALDKLGDQVDEWEAVQDDPEFRDEARRKLMTAQFVERVENVLLWERQEWYETALQAQNSGDRLILGDLAKLTQRADKAVNG